MPDEETDLEFSREADLARAACAGDRDAFAGLFKLLYPRIHRTVWAIMGNSHAAHDVCQEAWIKAWNHRDRFSFQSRFSTWIHRIAVNAALDALRKRKSRTQRLRDFLTARFEENTNPEQISAPAMPTGEVENRELGKAIEVAIAELPEAQRTVLVLREYEGYSYEEIANIMQCKPGTVMSRLHLARQKLQARLGRYMS